VTADIEPKTLPADVGDLVHRAVAVPGDHAGGGDLDVSEHGVKRGFASKDGLGHRTSTDVAGADEEDLHAGTHAFPATSVVQRGIAAITRAGVIGN